GTCSTTLTGTELHRSMWRCGARDVGLCCLSRIMAPVLPKSNGNASSHPSIAPPIERPPQAPVLGSPWYDRLPGSMVATRCGLAHPSVQAQCESSSRSSRNSWVTHAQGHHFPSLHIRLAAVALTTERSEQSGWRGHKDPAMPA